MTHRSSSTGELIPAEDKLALFHAWSSGALWEGDPPGDYQGLEDCEHAWRSFGREAIHKAGIGTLVHHAREGGYDGPVTLIQLEQQQDTRTAQEAFAEVLTGRPRCLP